MQFAGGHYENKHHGVIDIRMQHLTSGGNGVNVSRPAYDFCYQEPGHSV